MIDGSRLGVLVLLAVTLLVQGSFRSVLPLSPQPGQADGRRRPRRGMVGTAEIPENLMTEWLGLPPLAAAHGAQIDSLIGWTHIFMLVLFVGWGGFFAFCLVRFRRSQQPVANYAGVKSHSIELPRDCRRRRRSGPAVCLLGPALGRAGRSHAVSERGAGRPGHGRAVRLEHPLSRPRRHSDVPTSSCSTCSPTRSVSIETTRRRKTTSRRSTRCTCPSNKPVIVRLRSKDVIHSFGVPEFRVKQDAIPGLTIPIWFIPNVTTAEMRAQDRERRVPVRDRVRTAVRAGPCADARIRHRREPRGIREVAGAADRGAERTGFRSADRRGRARPPSRDALRRPRRAGPTLDQQSSPAGRTSCGVGIRARIRSSSSTVTRPRPLLRQTLRRPS